MNFFTTKRFASLFLLSSLIHTPAHGADIEESAGALGIYFENDVFAGTDRYYTNGVMISWSSPNLQKYSDTPYANPLLPLFDILPYINDANYQKNLVFVFGQDMYTPSDTQAYKPLPSDRPYAGWLYGGTGVVWKDAEVRNSLLLDIGVVGPWSLAQQTQRTVHDMLGIAHPNGWDNQLHNELGLDLVYERVGAAAA